MFSRFSLGAGIAQLVVLGLAAKVSRVRSSSGDIFRLKNGHIRKNLTQKW